MLGITTVWLLSAAITIFNLHSVYSSFIIYFQVSLDICISIQIIKLKEYGVPLKNCISLFNGLNGSIYNKQYLYIKENDILDMWSLCTVLVMWTINWDVYWNAVTSEVTICMKFHKKQPQDGAVHQCLTSRRLSWMGFHLQCETLENIAATLTEITIKKKIFPSPK